MTHIINMDPNVLESCYSNEDMLDPITEMVSSEWKEEKLSKIRSLLEYLPPLESDIIHLYFFLPKKKRQTDIAAICGITQAAVSYRKKRALERINFLLRMPEFDWPLLMEDLKKIMPNEEDAQIYYGMAQSTCQSEVAKNMGINQGRVRHRYLLNLSRLGWQVLVSLDNFLRTQPEKLEEVRLLKLHYQQLLRKVSLSDQGRRKKESQEDDTATMKELAAIQEILSDLGHESSVVHRYCSYYFFYLDLRYNFNILHEVQLPRWSGRAAVVFS